MPKALLSVYDKTNLVDFAGELIKMGWTIIASGGTAKLLRDNNMDITEVADYTASPEILNGRVKTLHPAIHGGLLARPTQADHDQLSQLGWDYIDLVAVNLYPFETTISKPDVTLEDAIENIDIGGVALIRAAAKNFERVTLVCDPDDYSLVLDELKAGEIKLATKKQLAVKGFAHTSHYDTAIFNYLNQDNQLLQRAFLVNELRYGENPHQKAQVYSFKAGAGPLGGKQLQGKELSYNNLLDLDAAWRAVISFDKPTICINKHLSPCGIASASQLVDAYIAALASDPVSAFGSVIASNIPVDEKTAQEMGSLFVECVIAPGFSKGALEAYSKKKNCRLVEMPKLELAEKEEFRSINNGLIKQSIDMGDPEGTEWKCVTKRQPSEEELQSLKFAWKACQHVKSNAIVFVQGEATVGIGGGQPNRVDCVKIAKQRAGDKSVGAIMASDAFFPFPDSVEEAAKFGITAIVQPGGSVRDKLSIDAANEAKMTMMVTGVRHFRH